MPPPTAISRASSPACPPSRTPNASSTPQIPVITSQSFLKTELDGAGYGTAGHLMTVIGFTKDGDVIANDPASPDNAAVRHVYKRRQFENIWLRTKRHDANGQVKSGSGGVCYLYFPAKPAPTQHRVLAELGIR